MEAAKVLPAISALTLALACLARRLGLSEDSFG